MGVQTIERERVVGAQAELSAPQEWSWVPDPDEVQVPRSADRRRMWPALVDDLVVGFAWVKFLGG